MITGIIIGIIIGILIIGIPLVVAGEKIIEKFWH